MKRCLFGVLLLAVLLWMSLASVKLCAGAPREIARQIHSAAEAALESNWEKSTVLAERAMTVWGRYRPIQGLFHSQEELLAIDIRFSQLGPYLERREAADFAAACLSLETQTRALAGEPGLPFLWQGQ